uniref:Uncharacterized protein n=1 Tax=Meloidogyne enterolobii TaxID=390850 RepID=A0A6V7VJJ2_MELEN|nr:unnamed protein product [Meloidogyne enterolobii]
MIKFVIILLLYSLILLNIKCSGKLISIKVKINDDWEEKREFIYLKIVELKERFIVGIIEKRNNQRDSLNKNIEPFLHKVELTGNIFRVKLTGATKSASDQLKERIVIEITNNEIIKNLFPSLEKRVYRYNYFIEKKNNYYETSILNENNKDFNSIDENIQNYKDKLLSSYWSEINLIGYKIELLEKTKS